MLHGILLAAIAGFGTCNTFYAAAAPDSLSSPLPSMGGNSDSSESSICSLYLAESTIPNAGFGVYTTRAYEKGEEILRLLVEKCVGVVKRSEKIEVTLHDLEVPI